MCTANTKIKICTLFIEKNSVSVGNFFRVCLIPAKRISKANICFKV